MYQKRLLGEMALCIVLGISAGLALAFRYRINPYLAAVIGGFVGILSFHPRELLELMRKEFTRGLTMLIVFTVPITSIAVHWLILHAFLSDKEPLWPINWPVLGWTYLWSLMAFLITSTVVSVFIEQYTIEEAPSWKMAITARVFKKFGAWNSNRRLDRDGTAFKDWHLVLALAVFLILFAPLSISIFLIFFTVHIADGLLTTMMFIASTPRLAILWGSFVGVLTGCIFFDNLFIAIVVGCTVGIPTGLFLHVLRWYLANKKDQIEWGRVHLERLGS